MTRTDHQLRIGPDTPADPTDLLEQARAEARRQEEEDQLGARLARLADEAQVLVVTHSPQVASKGDAHFRIEKAVDDGTTRTDVVRLGAAETRDEIARMLSGDHVTDAARAAADALLG